MGYRRLPLGEGFVEYLVDGPEDARDLVILHLGTPSAAVLYPGLVRAAAARSMRVACYSRGGYGASPRREGRSVADEAATTAALADRLGFERFLLAGWSGGGPMALAGAALLRDRVKTCVLLASLAPRVEAGPEWDGWFTPEQLREWNHLAGDPTPLIPEVEEAVSLFGHMTPRRLRSIGGEPDARAVAENHDTNVVPGLVRGMRRRGLARLLRLPRRQPRPSAGLGLPRRRHPRPGRRPPRRARRTGRRPPRPLARGGHPRRARPLPPGRRPRLHRPALVGGRGRPRHRRERGDISRSEVNGGTMPRCSTGCASAGRSGRFGFRLGLRQIDVATRAGVSRPFVSKLERGRFRSTDLGKVEAVCAVLGADLDVRIRWRGEGLDRLLDEGHAALVDGIVDVLRRGGWELALEATFNDYGDRGSIDVFAHHPATGELLVVEVKSVVADAQGTLAPLDRKVRVAPKLARARGWPARTVSRLLVIGEGPTNRRRVARFGGLFDAALPVRGWQVRRWLASPAGRLDGLLFLSNAPAGSVRRPTAGRTRVRLARKRPNPCQVRSRDDV